MRATDPARTAISTPARRRLLRRALAPLAVAVALAGCTTTVHPPATPDDPVAVFVLDHGRSASLVLPRPESGLVRWAYGDWRWYALDEQGFARAIAALFWPTRAGLGRERLVAAPTAEAVRAAVGVEIAEVHTVLVARGAAHALVARLDGLFEAALATRVVNAEVGLEFVHHPRPYTLLHNSNHVVAVWLRELGCKVRGRPLLTRWRVQPAGAAASTPAEASARRYSTTAASGSGP